MAESISGSDPESNSDDSEAEGNPSAKLSSLIRRRAAAAAPDQEDAPRKRAGPGKAPLIWFSAPQLPSEVSLGVYRAVFSNAEQAAGDYLGSLREKQLARAPATPGHFFMCMIGGGHFAAMVVSLAPKAGRGRGEREPVVIEHKTFHRYTTRRKQGGAQSANDNSKGNAHSAGASIRRHNEAALTSEVRDLLASWKPLIDSADLLFVRASGTANRRTLFSYEDAVLHNNDPRMRGFPFSTRRATRTELLRCFQELTKVKVSRVDVAALALAEKEKTDKANEKLKEKTSLPLRPASPKLSPEEEEASMHTTQLNALIRRSKAPAVLSYLTSNNLPPDFRFFPPISFHHSPTPLHLAASLNSHAVVSALLTKAGADPTITNDDSKKPFDLAGDRATRDAFRIARSELGEAKWNWEDARVPAPLTKAEAVAKGNQEKAEAEKEEKERRDKEVARIKEEVKAGTGKAKAGVLGTGMGRMEEESRGLSAEAKMRLDRERRARAAEERIRKMQGK